MKLRYSMIGLTLLLNSTFAYSFDLTNYFSPKNMYLSIAGVAASAASETITQSHADVSPDEMIPDLNETKLNGGTGGFQLGAGYLSYFPCFNLSTGLNYLYLAGQDQQTQPFYATDIFSSAFVRRVSVNALTVNAGISHNMTRMVNFYGDAGIGAAFLNTYATYATNTDALNVADSHGHNNTNFTWRVGVGSVIRLNCNWSLDLGIHYADFGPVQFGIFARSPSLTDGITYSASRYRAWLFSIGLDYGSVIT